MGYTTKKMKKEEHKKLCIFVENMDYETSNQFGYEIILGFKQAAYRDKWDGNIIFCIFGNIIAVSRQILAVFQLMGGEAVHIEDRIELGKCGYFALNCLINHVSISRTMLRAQYIERASTAPPDNLRLSNSR